MVDVFGPWFVLPRIKLLLQILAIDLHVDFSAVNFEPVKERNSVFGLLRSWKLDDSVALRSLWNVITRNLDRFNFAIPLEIIHNVWLIDMVHLLFIDQALNTNLTILFFVLLIILTRFCGPYQCGSDATLPLLHLLLEFGCLSRPILLGLRCLYHQSLSIKLLAWTC